MRIVAGQLKGKILENPPPGSRAIRPTRDRIRQALFNSLEAQGCVFEGAAGMDLFAGTGALGLEAVSRGAFKMIWADENPTAVGLIRKNLQCCGLSENDRHVVLQVAVATALSAAPVQQARPFRVVFLDPPYDSPHTVPALVGLQREALGAEFLEPGAFLILEVSSHDDTDFGGVLGARFRANFTRDYGATRVYMFQWSG